MPERCVGFYHNVENDGQMEITLISVKDKVSSTEVLSASFNFAGKI